MLVDFNGRANDAARKVVGFRMTEGHPESSRVAAQFTEAFLNPYKQKPPAMREVNPKELRGCSDSSVTPC